MKSPDAEWRLDARRVGRRVLIFDHLDSTNNLAAGLATEIENDGVVVLAREQSAGRGQYGRSWFCPVGTGILLSVLVFPPEHLRRPALLTAWAVVSVCKTIQTVTGLQARIKWPNDVLILGRKVCGILIEQAWRPSGPAAVAGIGLNINQSEDVFTAAGLAEAGSLAMFTGQQHDWEEMARQLVSHLDEEYDRLCAGDLVTLEACWRWRIGLLGKSVVAECHNGIHRGRLRELGWDGVELESRDGALLCLRPETVRQLRAE